jgi:hypothetical protein
MGIFFDPIPGRVQVWMNGGGGQSAGIAALICQGKLPKPDYAILVDTGRERTATFDYYKAHTLPALSAIGVNSVVIEKELYATVDLTSKNGRNILIPAFTDINDGVGKLTNYCSKEWKLRVKRRWLRDQGIRECDTWLGISFDEVRRVRKDDVKWDRTLYPLIDLQMRRHDCDLEVARMGWPKAPRSACWMCPNACDGEWQDMKRNHPADFARAVAFERELRKGDPNLWLHESCVPLDEVDLESKSALAFEKGCETGMCFT